MSFRSNGFCTHKRVLLLTLFLFTAFSVSLAPSRFAYAVEDVSVDNDANAVVTTITGKSFNSALKTLAAGHAVGYGETDSAIRHIVFEPYTDGALDDDEQAHVQVGMDGDIKAIWSEETSTITLRSPGGIKLNSYMGYMFSRFGALEELDLTNLETTDASYMHGVFFACTSLAKLNVGDSIDTSGVETMDNMFDSCGALTVLDLSSWRVDNSINISETFQNCTSLKVLNLEGWNPARNRDMDQIFMNCSSLQSLNLNGWATSEVVTADRTFYGCASLQNVDLTGWDMSSVASMRQMFTGCQSLTGLLLASWDVSACNDFRSLFRGCSSLGELDIDGWAIESGSRIEKLFDGCTGLRKLSLGDCIGADLTAAALPEIAHDDDFAGVWVDGASFGHEFTSADILQLHSGAYVRLRNNVARPSDVSASQGEPVSFGVSASGAASYRWEYSTDGGATWAKTWLGGCRTSTLSFAMEEWYAPRLFRCQVVFVDGTVAYSDPAALTVKRVISGQPSDVSASQGEPVSFGVSASGAASYRWEYSTDGGATWAKTWLGGCRTSTLSFAMEEWYAPRLFRCQVVFVDGTVAYSDPAALT